MIVNVSTAAPAASVSKAPVTVVPFEPFGRKAVQAHKKFDKASQELRDTMETIMQQVIDLNFQANGRTEAACKAMHKAIMSSDAVTTSIHMGTMQEGTWKNYSASAQRALYWNIPYQPGLFNLNGKMKPNGEAEPNYQLPWSSKANGKPAGPSTKSGGVTSTNRAELDKTLSKALQQMRLISLEGTAADLLDFLTERLADFKEIK